jgi:phosphate transport system substrate-binding protein
MLIRVFLASALLLLLSPSLHANSNPTLNWVGCGISKKAYVTDLAKAFEKKTNIHINVQGGGATKGIRHVVSGAADLGGTCRYNLPDNPLEAGVGLEPVAWDSLVVITNKETPVDNLSLKQVRQIYTGRITNWKELGGPDAEIVLFTRKSKNSGVGRTLRKLIFANFDQELVTHQSFPSTGPLEKAIIKTPFSLGITGISSAKLRDVKILKLGDVYPDYDNVKKGKYQLYRPLYISYDPDSNNIKEVRQFIRFCHSKVGRDIMRKNGTLPYREGIHLVASQLKQDLQAFRDGAELSAITTK